MKRSISELTIYPIKSLGPVSLSEAELTQRGFKNDRRWMLINERNQFLTIRQHPEFLFYDVSLSESGIRVEKKDSSEALELPLALSQGDTRRVTIWDDEVDAIVADAAVNSWFSQRLNLNCELAYLPDASPRRVQPEWVKEEQHVSFADGYPYLIVGEASLNDLNDKVEDDLVALRFRPNIVVSGGKAYEEFLWSDLEIGDAKLRGIKPCTRCNVTTFDPITGRQGKEPLKTLFHQRVNDKMIFGHNAIMTKPGVVKVGDELIINSVKQTPYEKV